MTEVATDFKGGWLILRRFDRDLEDCGTSQSIFLLFVDQPALEAKTCVTHHCLSNQGPNDQVTMIAVSFMYEIIR